MTGLLQTRNAEIRTRQHRVEADHWRRGHKNDVTGSVSSSTDPFALVIRAAGEADFAGIRRLYELEGRRPLSTSALLVAEVEGELVAALPLDGNSPVADPFQPTAELVELLRIRANQLQPGRAPSGGRMRRAWQALRGAASQPVMAPLAGDVAIPIRHEGE